jgi:hypothetical protein
MGYKIFIVKIYSTNYKQVNTKIMNKLIFIIGLCLSMYLCQAQQTNSEKDILKLMEVNGSAANYDLAIDQMIAQYKMIKPNVPAVFWESARRDVFDKEIVELNKKLVPVYQKNFSPAEIKQLIEFYQSPLGKKLTDGTAKIGKESIQVAQTWGISLGGKLNSYLLEKGM